MLSVQAPRALPPDLRLDSGGHRSFDDGVCLLEAASYMAGEPWSDRPECVAPVLATFGRELNDVLPDDLRQELVPFIPRLIGTAGSAALDEKRGLLALDWLIRVYTPAWLRLVPALVSDADALANASPIVDLESAAAVGDSVRAAATHASVTWDAAWAAAGYAAWAAAGYAAWDATRAAAWAATRAAAWAAAVDAAWAAAVDAARAVAWAAAGYAFAPTVTHLQRSAIELYDRMIGVAL